MNFDEVDSLGRVSKRFNHLLQSTEGEILCIIIGDVHQFICHCLIPLYPWSKYRANIYIFVSFVTLYFDVLLYLMSVRTRDLQQPGIPAEPGALC